MTDETQEPIERVYILYQGRIVPQDLIDDPSRLGAYLQGYDQGKKNSRSRFPCYLGDGGFIQDEKLRRAHQFGEAMAVFGERRLIKTRDGSFVARRLRPIKPFDIKEITEEDDNLELLTDVLARRNLSDLPVSVWPKYQHGLGEQGYDFI